ncbi:GNAT family N-acetyltransferase [Nonomuraea candida]|uniref:GNAT family N-acetyltransferase n=1 Tax=Nonomuraea candida TaxID=359159 RepID=UPI000B17E087|nr:GNAT family N-acetyltransferase [Nonomuraea candida]
MIEVVRAAELGESYRRGIAEVFIDGFGPDFSYFSKDPAKLTDALEHALVLDLFYVALLEGRPAGITACTDGRQPSFRHDKRELRRHLGLYKGTVADFGFRREFSKSLPYAREGMASLEFVATGAAYRGRGVATALLTHLLALPQYDEYVLAEISDINTPALRLYEKLGFREFERTKVRHTQQTGINYYISMRLVQA